MTFKFEKYAPSQKTPTMRISKDGWGSIHKASRDLLKIEGTVHFHFYWDATAKVFALGLSHDIDADAVKMTKSGQINIAKMFKHFGIAKPAKEVFAEVEWLEKEKKLVVYYPGKKNPAKEVEQETCNYCEGEGEIHDADFSDGDSDQQMFLKQDTLRDCPKCKRSGVVPKGSKNEARTH